MSNKSENFVQWRRKIEEKHGYQGLTFSIMEKNGKVSTAQAFSSQSCVGEWPSSQP